MRFKLKTLAAAAILATAGQAFAAVSAANSTNGTEVIFYAWDQVTQTSYVFDTGLSFASFRTASVAANTNQSFAFSGTEWNSFVSSVGGDFSNTTWGVMALKQGLSTVDGGVALATTVTANGDLIAAEQTSGNIKTINTFLNPLILAANTSGLAGASHQTGDFASVSDGAAYWGNVLKSDYAVKLNLTADNTVGTDSYKFYLVEAARLSSNAPAVSEYAGEWSFNGTTLNYAVAAVPEPESYAMLLAGLGLMGAVARRRRLK
jgi:hypothetical protein